MPFINDMEIRIRNNAYEFNRQRYSLRIEPRGIGETKAIRQYHHTQMAHAQADKERIFNRNLRYRYNLVADLFCQQSLIKDFRELEILYEDKIQVLRQMIVLPGFDITDVVKAENNLTDLKFRNMEYKQRILRIRQEIGELLNLSDLPVLDTAGFISVNQISRLMTSISLELDTNNTYLAYSRLSFSLAKSRLNLEAAEARRFVNFFEFSYDHGNRLDELELKNAGGIDYELDKAYYLNVAIRLPFINTDRHTINRRKLSYFSALEDYDEQKLILTKNLKNNVEEIRLLLDQYNFLKEESDKSIAGSSLNQYLEMEGIDPLILLEIKESLIKNHIHLKQIEYEIIKSYIWILDVTGNLYNHPLLNYLSASLNVMEP